MNKITTNLITNQETNQKTNPDKSLPVKESAIVTGFKWKIKKSWFNKRLAIVVVLIALPLLSFFIGYWQRSSRLNTPTNEARYASLITMKAADLSPYNGSDPSKPIYIGLNGLVYDVSAGRSFYEYGASYHYLAGKDSSADLNFIGGDIIAKKYPVVARLIN